MSLQRMKVHPLVLRHLLQVHLDLFLLRVAAAIVLALALRNLVAVGPQLRPLVAVALVLALLLMMMALPVVSVATRNLQVMMALQMLMALPNLLLLVLSSRFWIL